MKALTAASSPLTSQGLVFLFFYILEIDTLFISENVFSFTRRVVSYFVLPLVARVLCLLSVQNTVFPITHSEKVSPTKCFGTGGPEFGSRVCLSTNFVY